MPKRNSTDNGVRAAVCLEAALAYLALGWSVIPVEPRGKRPLVPWLEFQRRCADVNQAREWFDNGKKANLAVVTGALSGVVVLDIDVGHGGKQSLSQLEREHGALPPTIEAVTGSGGRHLYFVHPGGVVRNRAGLDAGVDLRGDGGSVVAAPSVHRCGKRYRWKTGHAPGELPLSSMPAWLLGLARGDKTRGSHPLSHWRGLVRDGIGEGQRNASIASLAGHLLHRGVDAQVVLELLLTWNRVRCRPPLSDNEVARVVESIVRLHERGKSDGDSTAG